MQTYIFTFVEIEYRIDLFAIFILLGVVQAVFLSFSFLGSEGRKIAANRYQGFLMLSIAGVTLEILLMYTGYIVKAIHLVDFSEPLAFMMGPMIYFIVVSSIDERLPRPKWPHLVLPVAYCFYNFFLHIQPEAVKYNGYLNAYHPDWERLPVEMMVSDDPLGIRSYHSLIVALSISLYTVLALVALHRYTRSKGYSLWRTPEKIMQRSRNYILISLTMLAVLVVAKTIYDHDLGDHFIGAVITGIIYFTSFDMMRSSTALKSVPGASRYKRSSLTDEKKTDTLDKVRAALEEETDHLQIGYGLNDLAAKAGVSTHHLSETINEGFGKTFFELLAEYRIHAACELLKTEEGQRLKMEEVAERVGYSSKSSFNTQFKKITGKTPSVYRNGL